MALKLGPNKLGELQVNLELAEPKTMPAIDRYTGVLFDALKLGDLTKQQLARAKESVFIQSSLFGLISALDEIPNYRLSAGAKLPGMNLRSIWASAHEGVWEHFRGELIVDLRSKSYSLLAPIPSWIESYEVAIVSEGSGGIRKALNHFNKQSKGNFIRAALTIAPKPIELGDLKKVAKLAGLKLEIKGKTLLLITQV
ncbi:unannotated protein [freshwater metagenome]|uniref:Unannotated protein n=1 Tax=freshwater metagenome TaxID=449393 RepID=A0A6J6ILQ5_9ZZZZ